PRGPNHAACPRCRNSVAQGHGGLELPPDCRSLGSQSCRGGSPAPSGPQTDARRAGSTEHCRSAVMNHPSQPLDSLEPEELQHLLDRLVDGELAPPEQQALLRHLDQIESGWRRCALAFVEAQVWKQELG